MACGDPCTELAKKICDCSTTISEQQACTQRVDQTGKKSSFSSAQKEQCEHWIDLCDPVCDTLHRGELDKCGLANESLAKLVTGS